ncbi:hypothetical protein DBV05_g12008 [Lasiodiplodia theobromae]|uniref:EGF-like domain-containing protein n=1 Tax=Lasiodiplodia theobromae TaxID=45133 RepID=A0A5N5CVE2_9PEZI|nr:hypothetical protein DBV05_g12008 [Lasiodiplodia theobromae]
MGQLQKRAALCLLFLLISFATDCTTDDDCSLNGICTTTNATCLCDPGWRSTDCGELDLRPATRGTGYNHTSTSAASDPFSGGTAGNASWGGQILPDRHGDRRKFHLITSQFSHGCGLSGWKPFSTIIRAESTTGPRGPYVWAQELFGAFTHNPTAVWSPADDLYLLFMIGRDDYELPETCKHQGIMPNNISIATSPDLRTWTPRRQVLTNATNPAPWPLFAPENRTVRIALAVEDNIIHVAASYNASFEPTVFQPAEGEQPWSEDPFLWRDKRGHWHILVHYMIDIEERDEKGPNVGAHLYSRTLEGPWTFNTRTIAYNTTVQFDDGTETVLYRRERPKLYFDPEDEEVVPLYLVNGVQENGTKASYTLVQPIGDAAEAYEKRLGFY